MSKAFCIPSVITAFMAMVLLLVATISVPTTFSTNTNLDFVRASGLSSHGVNITDTSPETNNQQRIIDGIRMGTWGYCTRSLSDSSYSYCRKTSHGWQATFNGTTTGDQAAYQSTTIKSSWTRGLALHVVAFVAAVVGLVLAFVPHLMVQLVAFIVLLLATLFALLAFIIDIVLFIYARNRLHQISDQASVMPGPGFYVTLIAIPLLFFSAITACCGRRRDKNTSAGADFSAYKSKPAASEVEYGTTQSSSIPMNSRQKVLDAFKGSETA